MSDLIEEQASRESKRFLQEEIEFHLGGLPTEQAHPKTRELSETTQRNTAEGAGLLLSVDHDLAPKAKEVFRSSEFLSLVTSIIGTTESGGTIAFSGCGATGRLAIILEKMWRSFWHELIESDARNAERWKNVADRSYSIMTGGDRALIRSVENFEDFQRFGRRQVIDAGLGQGDLLIAISEGGETSSVIGTAWEALERGARVYFVFNNPSEVLSATVGRSREVIECDEIIKLDLATGPMALSGSTRLQATTMEMLVVGAAMEIACRSLVSEGTDPTEDSSLSRAIESAETSYVDSFDRIVAELESEDCLAGIASFIDLEAGVYVHDGLVTYLSDQYLLDIISDTTERTPTFMLPPFRPQGDAVSAVSWAYTKDPMHSSNEAWNVLLGRQPRGLDWTSEDYRAMGGLDRMIASPPKLDREEILSYRIGSERDPSRFDARDSALLLLTVGAAPRKGLETYLRSTGSDFKRTVHILIGDGAEPVAGISPSEEIRIPVHLPKSPMQLFAHLAVKLILNTVSTATMAKLGRIRGNWMIQVDATNKKLIDRATRIISDLAAIPYEEACLELHRTLARRAASRERFGDSTVVETLKRIGKL